MENGELESRRRGIALTESVMAVGAGPSDLTTSRVLPFRFALKATKLERDQALLYNCTWEVL